MFFFFKCSGNVSGTEPQSMVCKIGGRNERKLNFFQRLTSYALFGISGEDSINRNEIGFYQKIAPHLIDMPFKCPKVFFAGTIIKKIRPYH